jgi:hypothetical protein
MNMHEFDCVISAELCMEDFLIRVRKLPCSLRQYEVSGEVWLPFSCFVLPIGMYPHRSWSSDYLYTSLQVLRSLPILRPILALVILLRVLQSVITARAALIPYLSLGRMRGFD